MAWGTVVLLEPKTVGDCELECETKEEIGPVLKPALGKVI